MTNGSENKVEISSSRLKELTEKEERYDIMRSCYESLERCFKDMMHSKDIWYKHYMEAENELNGFKTDFHSKIREESHQYIDNLLSYYANSIANSFEDNLKDVRCGFWDAKISVRDLACLKHRLRQMIKNITSIG